MTRPAARSASATNVVILQLPPALPRFTGADRATLFDEAVRLSAGLGLTACLYDEEELGEFATFALVGRASASWCVARQKGALLLWNAQTGVDVGHYPSMYAVLQAIEAISVSPDRAHVKLFGDSPAAEAQNVVCLQTVRARRSEARCAGDAAPQTLLECAL